MYILNSAIYKTEHILYIIISLALIIVGAILIMKKAKSENTRNLIIKISAILLLATIIINRVSITYYKIYIEKELGYNWLYLIPNTFCGFAALIYPFAIFLGKKDNIVLHVIPYIGFIGGVVTTFYPEFLGYQTFFDVRSITSLIQHSLMVWLTLICLLTKYIKPTMKKALVFTVGFCVIMTVGIIEIEVLHFPTAMQINDPLLPSLPVLTSWYVMVLGEIIANFIFIVIYEKYVNKKTFKEMFKGEN